MTARPLPPHGTYARANGSPGYREPCGCQDCIVARRRRKKHTNAMRQLGRPGKVDAAPARGRLLMLHQKTGWNDLATALDSSAANLRSIAYGRRITIRRITHNKIMVAAVESSGGKYIDATGTRRRIQALRAIGWSIQAIARQANTGHARIQAICGGQPTVRIALATKIRAAYKTLSQQRPNPGSAVTQVKNAAARSGFPPPGAWDDIDDSNAAPDWTGHCGTDDGWWMHSVNNIPACPRCQTAHDTWLAERRHLPSSERFRELCLAKGAASNRGASIAADGRELMRVSGLSYEQAAERLGVTRNHLQQELLRHPADEVAGEGELAVAA